MKNILLMEDTNEVYQMVLESVSGIAELRERIMKLLEMFLKLK